jgi:hypothetical protein
VHVVTGDLDDPVGSFALRDIRELAGMAGQAWPDQPGVQVRFVIEARRPGQSWAVMWSAPATPELNSLWDKGVDAEFALITFQGMSSAAGALEWRLARRTTVTHDEIIDPDAADDGA